MSRSTALRTADVAATRVAFTRGAADRRDQLRACAARPIRAVRTLREWHDLLLFVVAHPSDPATHAFAQAELARIRERTALVASHGLLNSGLGGAAVDASYSLPLVRWLLQRWPGAVSLSTLDTDDESVRDVLRTLLLPVEIEAADLLDGSGDDMLAAVFGNDRTTQLTQLVARLDQLTATDAVRDGLFARLGVYVRIAEGTDCALTTARAPHAEPFCHDTALRRQVDVPAIVAEPIGAPVRLSAAARSALIDTARTVLAAMQRETDPVTHASDVTLHDMGRGLRIALFSLDLAHRLPFDSYVGFMAFRNGVPLAYGGAWIFPLRSKIGINVLSSQRGGESAWFFAQLLRLYHQQFGVTRFEAENYQLGHENPDGLKSGAYWFYYRAGFRPTTAPLQRLAAREADRLGKTRTYAVPLPRLRTLVAEGLELGLHANDAGAGEPIDTAALTRVVQRHIVRTYAGDRTRAEASAMRRVSALLRETPSTALTPDERAAYRLWALPLDLISDLETWPAADRRQLHRIVCAKGAPNEQQHQQQLARLPRLLDAWRRALTE
jgi:hypothetical protein